MCNFNERLNRQEMNSEMMFKQFDMVNKNIDNISAEIKSEIAQSSNANNNSTLIPNTTIISETLADDNMDSYGTIIEVDTKIFNVMIEQESVNVLRCFNCCGYNHKSTACKNRQD